MRLLEKHSRWTRIQKAVLRAGRFCFILFFLFAGAPNLGASGLASTARTEHDAKPPLVEEEFRIEVAVPESLRCRMERLHVPSARALGNSHTPRQGSKPPARHDLSPRRTLDKQNGLGAFLLC